MKPTSYWVPSVVLQLIKFIEEQGLSTAGLFRISGNSRRMEQLKKALDLSTATGAIDFDGCNVHDVTGVLKAFLRDMPEPLVPYKLFKPFIRVDRKCFPTSAWGA